MQAALIDILQNDLKGLRVIKRCFGILLCLCHRCCVRLPSAAHLLEWQRVGIGLVEAHKGSLSGSRRAGSGQRQKTAAVSRRRQQLNKHAWAMRWRTLRSAAGPAGCTSVACSPAGVSSSVGGCCVVSGAAWATSRLARAAPPSHPGQRIMQCWLVPSQTVACLIRPSTHRGMFIRAVGAP